MLNQPIDAKSYSFHNDENDEFDENLDLFDHQQYGAYEDGIAYSEGHDEDEINEEINDEEIDLSDQPELDFSQGDPGEMKDYDELED